MKMIGMRVPCCLSACCRSGPLMPGKPTSRIRQLVLAITAEPRNASADGNVSTSKPECCNKSGNASRTDSLSSTRDTRGRLLMACKECSNQEESVHQTKVLDFRQCQNLAAQLAGAVHASAIATSAVVSMSKTARGLAISIG